jgi:P-type E1-E2 ATPase
MAIMVGTGRGAHAGVLVRNAEALEQLASVDVLLIDKTGTLTEGKPRVLAVEPATGFLEDEVLRLAAGVERGSAHPLASAVVGAAESRRLAIPGVSRFMSTTGKGVSGVVEGTPSMWARRISCASSASTHSRWRLPRVAIARAVTRCCSSPLTVVLPECWPSPTRFARRHQTRSGRSEPTVCRL